MVTLILIYIKLWQKMDSIGVCIIKHITTQNGLWLCQISIFLLDPKLCSLLTKVQPWNRHKYYSWKCALNAPKSYIQTYIYLTNYHCCMLCHEIIHMNIAQIWQYAYFVPPQNFWCTELYQNRFQSMSNGFIILILTRLFHWPNENYSNHENKLYLIVLGLPCPYFQVSYRITSNQYPICTGR